MYTHDDVMMYAAFCDNCFDFFSIRWDDLKKERRYIIDVGNKINGVMETSRFYSQGETEATIILDALYTGASLTEDVFRGNEL